MWICTKENKERGRELTKEETYNLTNLEKKLKNPGNHAPEVGNFRSGEKEKKRRGK